MASCNLQNFDVLSVDFAKSDFFREISTVRICLHESALTVTESEVLYIKIILDMFCPQRTKQIMQISNKNKTRTFSGRDIVEK